MRIVVLDSSPLSVGDISWAPLMELGDAEIYESTAPEDVLSRISGADAVLTNKVPLGEKEFSASPSLRYVGVLATGYNIIDIESARRHSITVTNIPSYGTESVAQFAMALLLELCHHIGEHSASVKSGRWAESGSWCYWDYPLIELSGKTMGIIGYGRIGRCTASLARAFGMRILAYDSHQDKSEEEKGNCRYVSLDELLSSSDVIALHCALTDETKGMIDKEAISRMKDGVLIINNSRGPLIAEKDLAEALESGKVGGAAVDVVSSEPIAPDNPLLTAPNTIITPHISWASYESRKRLFDMAIDNLKAFIGGKSVNAVS